MGDRNRHSQPPRSRPTRLGVCLGTLATGGALALGVGPTFAAQSIDELNSRIAGAREQAQALAAPDRRHLGRARRRSSRRRSSPPSARLSSRPCSRAGEERERRLEGEVALARHQLALARAQLRRSLNTLSARLVDIYRGGMPDATTLLLESDGLDDLQTRAEYLRRIEEADASLVSSVRSLRDQVADSLAAVEEAERRAQEFNEQIAAARDQIAAVRAQAEARAQQLAGAARRAPGRGREPAVAGRRLDLGGPAPGADLGPRRPRARSRSWFGDWAIPESIVQCESGGNFGAVNPTSGAGGAYQILPSTWDLYGGEGDPEDASPQEQTDIAAQIWADSGAAAWECAG